MSLSEPIWPKLHYTHVTHNLELKVELWMTLRPPGDGPSDVVSGDCSRLGERGLVAATLPHEVCCLWVEAVAWAAHTQHWRAGANLSGTKMTQHILCMVQSSKVADYKIITG